MNLYLYLESIFFHSNATQLFLYEEKKCGFTNDTHLCTKIYQIYEIPKIPVKVYFHCDIDDEK